MLPSRRDAPPIERAGTAASRSSSVPSAAPAHRGARRCCVHRPGRGRAGRQHRRQPAAERRSAAVDRPERFGRGDRTVTEQPPRPHRARPRPTARSPLRARGPTATPAGTSGPATVCTGNGDNREFFAGAAAGVDWAVYCLVAEGRWFVIAGNYQRAGAAGWSSRTRVPAAPGSSCPRGTSARNRMAACRPAPTPARPPSATRSGRSSPVTTAAIRSSWTVARTSSWVATGTDIDEAAFRSIVAGLDRVAA